MAVLEKWHAEGGVFLVGYTMFRELSTNTKNNTLRNENAAKRFKELLLSPGPSLIIADEGHTIKNKKVNPRLFPSKC
jgi:transcriptional regulator ATRX